jgi:hypothetical protein
MKVGLICLKPMHSFISRWTIFYFNEKWSIFLL